MSNEEEAKQLDETILASCKEYVDLTKTREAADRDIAVKLRALRSALKKAIAARDALLFSKHIV